MANQERIEAAVSVMERQLAQYGIPRERLLEVASEILQETDISTGRPRVHSEEPVLELAAQGLSFAEIGKRLGIAKSVAHRIATHNGVIRGNPNPPAVEWTEEMKAQLAGMWRAGMSSSQIAKRFGITVAAVDNQRWRMNLKR